MICISDEWHPFKDKVGVEVVNQLDIDNRGVRLRAFNNDLGFEGLGRCGVFEAWLPLKEG
jgi:hypothetical protein